MDIKALKDRLKSEVIVPGDDAYDDARRVWNGMIDRHPGAVVRATGSADVMATVRFARETGTALAVRAGGHSTSGTSTCDDGIVLDLSRYRGVLVDPAAKTARVLGGTLLSELDHETMAHSLVTPTGTVGHTGVAGLTLGGGIGRLTRKYGLSIDNLRAVDIVTADGEQIRASETVNEDLFWAVRGAGANFGVVTMLEFTLHPMDQITYAAVGLYPLEQAGDALRAFRAYGPEAPDEMLSIASLETIHPNSPFPAELHGQRMLFLAASYCGGTKEEAERATQVVRTAGSPSFDAFIPAPYVFFQGMSDDAWAWSRRYYVKGGYFEEVSDQAIADLLETFDHAPSSDNEMTLLTLGGAMGRVPEDAMAFSGRGAQFFLGVSCKWDDPADDDEQVPWGRESYARMQKHMARENYINAVETTSEDVVRAAYGDEKYKRLSELKRTWDPDNLFRFNQNIRPA